LSGAFRDLTPFEGIYLFKCRYRGRASGSRWLLHSEAAFGIALPLPASDRRQSRMRV
jgi:hypothetical protein